MDQVDIKPWGWVEVVVGAVLKESQGLGNQRSQSQTG